VNFRTFPMAFALRRMRSWTAAPSIKFMQWHNMGSAILPPHTITDLRQVDAEDGRARPQHSVRCRQRVS